MKTVRFIRAGVCYGEPVAAPGRTYAPTVGDERTFEDAIAQDLIDTGYAESVEGASEEAPSASVGPAQTQAFTSSPETKPTRAPRRKG